MPRAIAKALAQGAVGGAEEAAGEGWCEVQMAIIERFRGK